MLHGVADCWRADTAAERSESDRRMQAPTPGYGTGILFVLGATFGWSLAGVFVRFLPGLDGWQINCWRGFWMSVFLLVYLVAVYGRQTASKFREVPLPALIAVAASSRPAPRSM